MFFSFFLATDVLRTEVSLLLTEAVLKVIKKLSENPCEEMYLQFVCDQLYLFNHSQNSENHYCRHRSDLGNQEI